MLVIILGSLAGIFFITTVILLICIIKRSHKQQRRDITCGRIGKLFFNVRQPCRPLSSIKLNLRDSSDVTSKATSSVSTFYMREPHAAANDEVIYNCVDSQSEPRATYSNIQINTALVPYQDNSDRLYDPGYAELHFGPISDNRSHKTDPSLEIRSGSGTGLKHSLELTNLQHHQGSAQKTTPTSTRSSSDTERLAVPGQLLNPDASMVPIDNSPKSRRPVAYI